tara:strand:+ start:3100 stop:3354 length:255 start_codon:yes stop_codon:yes gene_type:complete
MSDKVDKVFERPDLDDEKLVRLVRNIQHKLAFIEKKGGYTDAHAQMRKQLQFLLIELQSRQEMKIGETILNEKPFIIGEDPESK